MTHTGITALECILELAPNGALEHNTRTIPDAHSGSCSKTTEKQPVAIDVLDHEASETIIIVP